MTSEIVTHDVELAELQAEFEELSLLDDEFGGEGLLAFQELEQELASVPELGGEVGAMSIEMLTEDMQVDMLFLGSFVKGKVRKLLQKLVNLIRRHGSRLAACAPKVTRAIRLFKQGKYIAALRAAYDAYKCIRKAL